MPVTAKQIEEHERLVAQKLAAVPKLRIVKREEPLPPTCDKCSDQVVVMAGPYCDCPAGQTSARLWTEFQAANREAAKRRAEKARQKLERAGGFVVPERYKSYSPTSLAAMYGKAVYKRKEVAIKAALAWAKSELEKPGLVLTGDFGSGKTALALWAMRQRIRRTSEAALLIRYADFIGAIQETYSKNSGGEATKRELIYAAQTAQVLMLDDLGEVSLGNGGASNDKQTIMLEVLDYRTQHDLPTLIVTNLTAANLAAQFNGAIFGRLVELCELVTMGGKNLREKGATGW